MTAEQAEAPKWYSEDEVHHWLMRLNYSKEIADELSAVIAANWQASFEKGFAMGRGNLNPADDGERLSLEWLASIADDVEGSLVQFAFKRSPGTFLNLRWHPIDCCLSMVVFGGAVVLSTRGDLLRLLSALGIKLETSSAGGMGK